MVGYLSGERCRFAYGPTDEITLLHLYRVLIRSKLDYGSLVYGSARKSYLQMLEPIQNHALCLCLEHFKHHQSQAYMWKQMRCLWN